MCDGTAASGTSAPAAASSHADNGGSPEKIRYWFDQQAARRIFGSSAKQGWRVGALGHKPSAANLQTGSVCTCRLTWPGAAKPSMTGCRWREFRSDGAGGLKHEATVCVSLELYHDQRPAWFCEDDLLLAPKVGDVVPVDEGEGVVPHR